MQVRHTDDYIYDSLWEHSSAFRKLVYATALLLACILIGFWLAKRTNAQSTTQPSQIHSYAPTGVNTGSSTVGFDTSNSPPITTAPPPQSSLSTLPVAQNRWGEVLNPSGYVPNSGFDAYYINTNNPRVLIHKENVRNVTINYVYKEFHDIPSQDFGAYWVGKLVVPSAGMYELKTSVSWADVRIMIDKKVVLDKQNHSSEQNIFLEAGEYTLEVEYSNNWHTTDFTAALRPIVTTYTANNIRQMLAQLKLPSDTRLYAAAISESGSKDNTLNIQMNTQGEPFVLYLESNDAVEWNVYGPTPKAIIHTGKASAVSAQGSPPVFRLDQGLLGYRFFQNNHASECSCTGGHFYCGDYVSPDVKQEQLAHIKQVTGLELAGGSGAYSSTGLIVPTVYIDQTFFNNMVVDNQQMIQLRQACSVRTNTLMSSP